MTARKSMEVLRNAEANCFYRDPGLAGKSKLHCPCGRCMNLSTQLCLSCMAYLTDAEKEQLKKAIEQSADYVVRALAIRLSHRAQSRRGINH